MRKRNIFVAILVVALFLISSMFDLGLALYWSNSTVNNFVVLDNVPQGAKAQLKHSVAKNSSAAFDIGTKRNKKPLLVTTEDYVVDVEVEKDSKIGWGQYVPFLKMVKAHSDYHYKFSVYKSEYKHIPLIQEKGSVKMDGDFRFFGIVSPMKSRTIIEETFSRQVEKQIQSQISDWVHKD